MKVDLNLPISTHLPPTQRPGVRPNNFAAVSGSDLEENDVARLSGGSTSLPNLVGLLNSAGDVRQGRVEALRSMLAQGTYQPSPERIAEAMLSQATDQAR